MNRARGRAGIDQFVIELTAQFEDTSPMYVLEGPENPSVEEGYSPADIRESKVDEERFALCIAQDIGEMWIPMYHTTCLDLREQSSQPASELRRHASVAVKCRQWCGVDEFHA